MANWTLPAATSWIVAGLSLPNKVSGHSSDPCSRKLTRAWSSGQSRRLTSADSDFQHQARARRMRMGQHPRRFQSKFVIAHMGSVIFRQLSIRHKFRTSIRSIGH